MIGIYHSAISAFLEHHHHHNASNYSIISKLMCHFFMEWYNLEMTPQLLYFYQLILNHLLGDVDTKTTKSL